MGIIEQTEKKVCAYIEEHGMISPGDRIVAGVSGGADSVCLLEMLLAYGKRVPLELCVVHVNHGLREEAAEDAGYVEELCRQRSLPFFLTEADVRQTALEERCSQEDAGRRIRYRAFRQAAERTGAVKAAVAHNSNDNAETMLFHLFRGSGLKGISGIAPMRTEQGGICILRPLLCLERQEVEAYLRERGILWRVDKTNQGDDYRRNRIRHHILPYAMEEVCAGAVGHMLQTAAQLQETERYLGEQTGKALEQCAQAVSGEETAMGKWDTAPGEAVRESGDPPGRPEEKGLHGPCAAGYRVDVKAFQSFHEALRGRMLLELMKRLSPTGKDISSVHVRDVLSLFEREGNRSVSLPFGIRAGRRYDRVILERAQAEAGPAGEEQRLWQPPVEVPLTEELFRAPVRCGLGNLGEMEFSAFFIKKAGELPQNQYTKWFDYDKMEERAVIRFRSKGDFLTIADGAGKVAHKSVKDYMIAEKIPRHLRDGIPAVAFGSHILWLVGWRISEAFKVRGDTERVLQVKFIKRQGSGTEEKNVGAH